MNRFIAKNRFILVLFSIVICLSCAYGLTSKLDPEVNALGEKVSASDYSWATIADAAARYLNDTGAPDGNGGADVQTPSYQNGFAGNFLGYVSPVNGTKYSIGSIETNTTIYSYTSLKKLNSFMHANQLAWKQSAQIYSGFGYALTSSGIDEPVIIGQMADDKRNIIGPIVLIIFLLCMALPQFFQMILTFLSVANPFRLFIGPDSVLNSIVPSIGTGAGFDNQSSAIAATMSSALQTLTTEITKLYNALYSLSFFAIIPIMIALSLFSWLILRGKASSIFRKLATRIVFIGLGVPLLLACYTAAIDSVKDFTIDTATGTPITIISSTFCDYGTWVLGKSSSGYDYMRLPDTVTLKVDESKDSYIYDSTSTSDRRLVQALNEQTYNFGGTAMSDSMNATSIANDDAILVNSVAGMASADKTSAIINMLQSYTKGEYITASNLATKFNAAIAESAYADQKLKFNTLSTNWQKFDPQKIEADAYKNAIDASIPIPEADAKAFAQTRLVGVSDVSSYVNSFQAISSPNFTMSGDTAVFVGTNVAPMSRLAAYNLLSSTFSDTAIAAYSTTAASTNQVQLAHYSVSIAGQGYMELAYVFDACAIMACLMVLGYGYGFALLFACFKGLIQIFPKVLTGMLGSIKGIAGSCALVAALIIEILGTCIMYALSSMLIGGIYQLIEGPLATLLTTVVNLPQQAAALITVVASAVIIIKLTMLLLKYRTAIVKSVSEAATGFINKFMETNVVAPNLESGISAGGLASAGLGLAMVAGSTPVGNKLADRASSLTDKVMNSDADKVATAAMGGKSSTGQYGEKYASPDDAKSASSSEHSSASALTGASSGGVYSSGNNSIADTSEGEPDETKTPDDLAAGYVDNNAEDFESEIGLASKSKAGDGSETSKDYAVTDDDADVTAEASGKSGKSLVDNSTEEITGTKTTDVTSSKTGEAEDDGKSAPTDSKNAADNTSSAQTGSQGTSKLVMKDSHGNEEEVSIVNAKTGAAYTQADKDAGENYDVIGSDGKSVYAGQGKLDGGMSANTLAMRDGEAVMMLGPGSDGTKDGLNPYGGGSAYTLSPAQAPVAPAQDASVSQAAPTTSAPAQGQAQAVPPAAVAAGAFAAAASTVQNVNQTNVSQTTMNSASNMTENVSQSTNSQVTNQQTGSDSPVIMTGGSGNMNAGSGVVTNTREVINNVSGNSGGAGSPVDVHVTASAANTAAPVMGMPVMGGGQPGSTYVNVNAPSQGGNTGSTVQSTSEREITNNVTERQTIEREVHGGGGYAQSAPSQNINITNQTSVNNVSEGSSDSGASLGTGSMRNNRRR